MDRYQALRDSTVNVPCVKWTAQRATVNIPETEEWAGKAISITGLDKQVARKLARYIADANPATIQALLAERDALRAVAEEVIARLENYERHGEVCPFEGEPMIYAATLIELGEQARAALSQ